MFHNFTILQLYNFMSNKLVFFLIQDLTARFYGIFCLRRFIIELYLFKDHLYDHILRQLFKYNFAVIICTSKIMLFVF